MKQVNLLVVAFAILGALPAAVRGQDAFILPEAKIRVAYEFPIPTEGGLSPLHWKIAVEELPPGIELQSAGTLHGTPTTTRSEAYQFTIELTDSSQPSQSFEQRFSLLVMPAPLRILPPDNTAAPANPPLKIVTDYT